MATTAQALTVDPDQQAILKELAARELRSPDLLLRDAVNDYIARSVSSELDEATIQAHDAAWDMYDGPVHSDEEALALAEASWQHYKQTGLHVTHEEVCEWLDRLKTDRNAKPPACHT